MDGVIVLQIPARWPYSCSCTYPRQGKAKRIACQISLFAASKTSDSKNSVSSGCRHPFHISYVSPFPNPLAPYCVHFGKLDLEDHQGLMHTVSGSAQSVDFTKATHGATHTGSMGSACQCRPQSFVCIIVFLPIGNAASTQHEWVVPYSHIQTQIPSEIDAHSCDVRLNCTPRKQDIWSKARHTCTVLPKYLPICNGSRL